LKENSMKGTSSPIIHRFCNQIRILKNFNDNMIGMTRRYNER
jgi:hypothetical protein